MFLDNLSVHKNHRISEWATAHGMKLLFNAAYSCQFNPIESMWSYAKHRFFREEALLEAGNRFSQVELRARKSIEAVSAETMERCVVGITN